MVFDSNEAIAVKRLNRWQVGLRILLALAMGGTLVQLDLGCLGTIAKNVNPCGTILNCDPVEYDLLFADYPDWDTDPTCTIPGFCGGPFPGTPGGGE